MIMLILGGRNKIDLNGVSSVDEVGCAVVLCLMQCQSVLCWALECAAQALQCYNFLVVFV